jgi:hypothetical protein
MIQRIAPSRDPSDFIEDLQMAIELAWARRRTDAFVLLVVGFFGNRTWHHVALELISALSSSK